ncbi:MULTISPECIES: ABC transporter ATP-binding protein [Acidovorax]|jgi:branched-chain amino acid transport system ATP-binding protein|uniref:ABC transporter ATP-binding protein n=1 Tax=Acidovorax facilis TaxID=12917 RepID=A0ABV8D3T0_9BURK|nr:MULTISPECIES: ABC transporter ATP-binding protein [Acidovorax]KQB57878.1 ABC transporter [Acidovorax sp. SD340]MBO1006278.1 ABC transporter ATP-binding protein [Acidovorax sp. SD340]MCO4239873.1 ABC transporter ATP-binding protein [Acidovorax facilis]QLA83017.1 ABC transporter ATP-binding protein [Acidovorax sp. JMULE5]
MILALDNIHAHYGKSHVLQGVSFEVGDGELVTLLGRNGAGKTTTLKSIVGVVPSTSGSIRFAGKPVQGLPPHVIASQGVCLVPEHRGIFKLLTVEENLLLGQRKRSPWQLDDVYRIFPRLKERRTNGGGQLSGGEQQMLAIGRALMNNPKLLMLDEPVEGLAPVIVEEIVSQLKTIKAAGVAILLVEQNLEVCTQLADRHCVLEQGRIVYTADNATFLADEEVKDRYLGVGLV